LLCMLLSMLGPQNCHAWQHVLDLDTLLACA